MSDLWHQRIIGVGVCQQGADGKEDLGDGEGGTPLLLENVEADASVRVDVRVIDTSSKVELWRLERVIGREVDVQEVNTTGVRALVRSHDSRLPVELILLVDGTSRAIRWRVLAEVNKLLLNSFKGHLP